jgi:23S rRNA pseudouridine1911/1915/1917 synthase
MNAMHSRWWSDKGLKDEEFDIEDIELDDAIEDGGKEGSLYEHFRIVADAGQMPLRIDKFLFEHMQHSSRNRIQQAAEAGYIYVNGNGNENGNGKPVKSNYKVRPGDVVTLMLQQPKHDTTIYPEDIPLNIVYEDEVLMVVNKPAGMVVHPGAGNFNGTLINAVAWHMLHEDPALRAKRGGEEFDPNSPEVGLVHRIDKDTSGLLVVAKSPEAKTHLGKQFFNHDTHRSYNCLVWGHFAADEGRIEGNITRDPKDRQRMTVVAPETGIGKPAVTHWRVLEKFGYTTLIECRLETGRTHQIRAHMKHIGHPLFGDERYGGTEILRGEKSSKYNAFIQNCFKTCPRQALHAKTLGFRHPVTGEQMDFTSEWAEDFAALIKKWRAYIGGTTRDYLNEQK